MGKMRMVSWDVGSISRFRLDLECIDFDLVLNKERRFTWLKLGRPADPFGDRAGHGTFGGSSRSGGGAGDEAEEGQKRHGEVADDGTDAGGAQHACEMKV